MGLRFMSMDNFFRPYSLSSYAVAVTVVFVLTRWIVKRKA